MPPKPKTNALVGSPDDRKWRAEDAMRTITRAHEHMQDKALMRDVKALANKNAAVVAASPVASVAKTQASKPSALAKAAQGKRPGK